jgi:hypothetical protein
MRESMRFFSGIHKGFWHPSKPENCLREYLDAIIDSCDRIKAFYALPWVRQLEGP